MELSTFCQEIVKKPASSRAGDAPTRPTINFIENGRFVPSALLALKIARVFGVPFEEVFFLEDE